MKIKLTTVYVNDQEKALRFYTEVLGFAKKTDFSKGPFRWLTVTAPDDPNGVELQLAADDNPAGKAYQQAMFQQGQPAIMLDTDDGKAGVGRSKAPGARVIVGVSRPPLDGPPPATVTVKGNADARRQRLAPCPAWIRPRV